MNDFFADPNAEPAGMTEEQETDARAQIMAEVFEGTPAKFDDVVVDPEVVISADPKIAPETIVDDPELSLELPPELQPVLSPEMQTLVDSVNKLTTSLTGIEDRVKQTERRVGGISNEFYAAKDAAKEAAITQAKAPTPEAMALAAKDEEAWEDLKKDFPSWATAITSKITAANANFVSVDDFEALRNSVASTPSVDTGQLESRLVGLIHPDHKEIVADPGYATWLGIQTDSIKRLAYQGTTAEDAIEVFNLFKAQKAPVANVPAGPSEVEQIKAQNAARLAASTTTSTKHKTIKAKSPDDMTESELREHIAGKVFAT